LYVMTHYSANELKTMARQLGVLILVHGLNCMRGYKVKSEN